MRTCNRCGQTKDETEFAKNRHEKSGYFRWCRECWNEARRARYARNARPFKASQNRWRGKTKGIGGNCAWCNDPAQTMVPISGTTIELPNCGSCTATIAALGALEEWKVHHILHDFTADQKKQLQEQLHQDIKQLSMVNKALKNGSSKDIVEGVEDAPTGTIHQKVGTPG